MKLTINGIDVGPVLGALALEKRRSDCAATLTATLWTAAADTYFLHLSLAVGDVVRLADDDGSSPFVGSIHALERTPERVKLTAFDRGIFISRNEVHGVFAGSGGDICRAVAAQLGIACGTLEADSAYRVFPALSGVNAFTLLQKAAGDGREVTVEGDQLTVRKSRGVVFVLPTEQVREVSAVADIRRLCDHVTVVDYKGRTAATAQNVQQQKTYGVFRKVLGKVGSDPATQAKNALQGRVRSAEVVVNGNLNYTCRDCIEGRQPQWGLEGIYDISAVSHRWGNGQFTTELTLEGRE